MRKYEVSHICAAAVAVTAIFVFGAIALNGLVSFEASKLTEWISAVVSVGALITSGLALIYLRRTFEETKRQADMSSDQLDLEKKKTLATTQLGAASMRPQLSLGDEVTIVQQHQSGMPKRIAIGLKNWGASPGINICARVHWIAHDGVREVDVNHSINTAFLENDECVEKQNIVDVVFPHQEARVFLDVPEYVVNNEGDYLLDLASRFLVIIVYYKFPFAKEVFEFRAGYVLRASVLGDGLNVVVGTFRSS